MHDIYLLLGSNLGNSTDFLAKAIEEIKLKVGKVARASSLYQTKAWGKTDQPDFINQVIKIDSDLGAQEILTRILQIEKLLGRERDEKWGARVIDIDILFYNNEIIDEPNLQIPHPYFQERRFAVEPMLEIASDFLHPKLNMTINSIALELTDKLFVKNLNHK